MSRTERDGEVDDVGKVVSPRWERQLLGQRQRQGRFTRSLSEVMTIMIHCHRSHVRDFKNAGVNHVGSLLRRAFPPVGSYNRGVELMPSGLSRLGASPSASDLTWDVDSTSMAVWPTRRLSRHRTFARKAPRRKDSVGGFYGLKLQGIVEATSEGVSFLVTPGYVDDHNGLKPLAKVIHGQLFGDKG